MPGAPDLKLFEHLLYDGVDAVSEIPDERWAKYRYLHAERSTVGKTYTFAAGLIDQVDGFDSAFFGISPREAAQMDPQQRLILELAHEAVEDAGIDGAAIKGTPVGVYVGGSSWDYMTLHAGDPAVTDAYSMTGNTLCALANRVSYGLDLRGPSLTIDTACSSSLVALHQACEAIRSGQLAMAMVGGVSLLLAPHSFVGFSAASMLSSRGRCHSFDARADGYVRAEGGAMIVLRPLRDALANGDNIRGLIRGTGVNSDGRTAGFSLPNKVAQAELLREVYTRFRINPNELGYLEAHGTGTPVGDTIEAAALGETLGHCRTGKLPIGSVKTNIGHLEAASGMAGLLKAMFVVNRGAIPPSLHCETPNPLIPFAELNLELVPRLLPLPDRRRVAGVSSFGFGGTNAHAVIAALDSHAWTEPCEPKTEEFSVPLLLSARSMPALRGLALTWRDRLEAGPVDAAMLRGAALSREAHNNRLVATGSHATIVTALSDWLDDRGNDNVVAGEAASGKVAFVFSGNGSQWSGMGLQALQANATFRTAMAEVDAALSPLLGWSVEARMAQDGGWPVHDTTVAQPLLFALQVATVEALAKDGIKAEFFFGHSVGEIAAAWASGALRLDQACRVIATRSQLQALTAGQGRMGVLALSADRVEDAILGTRLEVAAWNASSATTLAGPPDDITVFAQRAEQERWAFTLINLEHAFHSAAMDAIEAPLLQDLAALAPPLCPDSFISTVRGGKMPSGSMLDAKYWWRNVREPVRFSSAAADAVARGARVLVEIGPQPVLQAYLKDALTAADATGRAVSSLTRRSSRGHDPIAIAAARCHVAGCDMRGAMVFAGARSHRDLPRYPWQRHSYWLGRSPESTDLATVPAEHPLLGARRYQDEALEWSNQLCLSSQPWLVDHVVGGAPVAPAALFIEMAFAAAKARHSSAGGLQITDFEIARPLTFEVGVLRDVRLRVSDATGDFQIASRLRLSSDPWISHATGRLTTDVTNRPVRPMPVPLATGERTNSAELYALARKIGLEYGPAFQVVTAVRGERGVRADVDITTPEHSSPLPAGLLLSPTLLDGSFQGLVALASQRLPAGDGVIPWRFGRIRLLDLAGTQPALARAMLTRVGPRSIRADIHLLSTTGEVLAELLDCWFVRVSFGPAQVAVESWTYHVANVPRIDPVKPVFASDLLPLLTSANTGNLPTDDAGMLATDDAGMLADAFAAFATEEAIRSLLPSPKAPFTIANLVATGLVAPTQQKWCETLLGWLAADGLATVHDGEWQLTGAALATADDVLRTLIFEAPSTVAEAALLAEATETLALDLQGECCDKGVPAFALVDHFLHDSPTGRAIRDALITRVATLARAWPDGLPLRVLQLGASRGNFSRHMLRALTQEGRALQLVALTNPADKPALADALSTFPDARAATWHEPALGLFDLVIGFCTFMPSAADLGTALALAPGGLVLLAEPQPSRSWSLIWPETMKLMRQGEAWCHALAAAGAVDISWNPIQGGRGAGVLAGIVPRGARPKILHPSDKIVLLVARYDDALASVIEQSLGAAETVLRWEPDKCAAGLASTPLKQIVVVAGEEAPVAPWLDHLRSLAQSAPERIPIILVTRDGPVGNALGGLRRVIANELPDVACRHVVLASDLPLGRAAEHAEAEIMRVDAETEVTWSDHGCTVPRLRLGLRAMTEAAASTPARLKVARPGMLNTIGWEETSLPGAPGPGEVAIRVRAAGLNFRDVMWAMGVLPDEALLDGFAGPTLGLECAGEVIAIGDGVGDFAPGDRVMAFAPASFATHAVTGAHAVVLIPDEMSFAAAATIPVAFLTVAYALGHLARIEAGERVLVHGGAGGVGLAAIQYAKLCGASVIVSAGSVSKRAMLRRLGVDAVLDSRSLTFGDEVMRLTNGAGVDVVLNSLSGEAMEVSIGLLRPYGRFLELGKRDFYENTRVGLRPFRHNIAYFGIDVDQLPLRQPRLASSLLADVTDKMKQGALRPLPYRAFDAADAPEAFRLMQISGHIGKIVLEFGRTLPAKRATGSGPLVRADRCYLVTGGLDGFGLQAAAWLARQGARHLALLSRRGGDTPGAQTVLNHLRSLGAEAVAYRCDVADEPALRGVLDEVREAMPPLAGILHAAVVMDDGLLTAMDEDRFARALRPKLDGTSALDRLTSADPLDFFVLFSSVTTVLGNPGQANYVAANAAAEAVILDRCRRGLPSLSVQWGPISDAGYLTRQAGIGRMLSNRLGGRLLSAEEALAILPALIASGEPVIGLANIRWDQLASGLPLLKAPMFDAVRGDAAEAAMEIDLPELLARCTPEAAQAKLTGLLAEEVARIMQAPVTTIPPHRPLSEFGMDSLMAVELRVAVEQRFGLSLPVLALSDATTLTAIAGRMARSVTGGAADQPDEMTAMVERISRFEQVKPAITGPAVLS